MRGRGKIAGAKPSSSPIRPLAVGPRSGPSCVATPRSVALGDEAVRVVRLHIAVGSLALGQGDLLARYLFVGNDAQKVRDAVQPSPAFLIGIDDVPRCFRPVGGSEHCIARPGIVVPAAI